MGTLPNSEYDNDLGPDITLGKPTDGKEGIGLICPEILLEVGRSVGRSIGNSGQLTLIFTKKCSNFTMAWNLIYYMTIGIHDNT